MMRRRVVTHPVIIESVLPECHDQFIITDNPSEVVKLTDIHTTSNDNSLPSDSPSVLLPPGELGMIVPLGEPLGVSTGAPIITLNSISQQGIQVCEWTDCGLILQSLEALVYHLQDVHVKLDRQEMYACHWNNCQRNGRGFNARYKILIHLRTHTNEKPHVCRICSKGFSRLENLKIHYRTHTGERPYACTVPGCTKTYNNSSDRFKHIQTHGEDRPYACKTHGCGKRYTDPSSLRKHARAYAHASRDDDTHTDGETAGGDKSEGVVVVESGSLCVSRIPWIGLPVFVPGTGLISSPASNLTWTSQGEPGSISSPGSMNLPVIPPRQSIITTTPGIATSPALVSTSESNISPSDPSISTSRSVAISPGSVIAPGVIIAPGTILTSCNPLETGQTPVMDTLSHGIVNCVDPVNSNISEKT